MWPFLVLFIVGVALCLLIGRWLVRRWRLPLRESLIYFGLLPHPDEEALPPRPSRRELAKGRQRADRRIERGRSRRPAAPSDEAMVGNEEAAAPTRRRPPPSRTGGDPAA